MAEAKLGGGASGQHGADLGTQLGTTTQQFGPARYGRGSVAVHEIELNVVTISLLSAGVEDAAENAIRTHASASGEIFESQQSGRAERNDPSLGQRC